MNSKSADLPASFSALLDTPELASLGPTPRASRKSFPIIKAELEKIFSESKLLADSQHLILGLVLLWHDHLDDSHSISQDLTSADGSFVHAIMHRREPDYWNAKYWFNRVGTHVVFPVIAAEVQKLCKTSSSQISEKFIGSVNWNPNVFVDLCERFEEKTTSMEYKLLQQIQLIETRVLLHHFVAGPLR